jgi:drug/metabolite transporter (DMT)-like permease
LPILTHVKHQHRNAILALAAAGILWGLGVPLSKLALGDVGFGWLTFVRFAVATPLLALVGRRGLREAAKPSVAASGAVGFGAVVLLQNAGLQSTSVAHAALLMGALPVLVALIGASRGNATQPRMWAGYAVALAGIVLVASTGGGGASSHGDLLVLASSVVSAAFIAASPRLLARHDAAALTAVQFAGGAITALIAAVAFGDPPPTPITAGPAIALAALSVATPLPFWLFAYGQARVPAEVAGAFINLEPVVGTAAGWLAFQETATLAQALGALAVLAGVALSTALPGRTDSPQSARMASRLRRASSPARAAVRRGHEGFDGGVIPRRSRTPARWLARPVPRPRGHARPEARSSFPRRPRRPGPARAR